MLGHSYIINLGNIMLYNIAIGSLDLEVTYLLINSKKYWYIHCIIVKYIGKVKRGFRQCRKMSVKGLLKGQSIKICYNAAIMYSNI